MTDTNDTGAAESEAALLAIGARLEWTPERFPNGSIDYIGMTKSDTHHRYAVSDFTGHFSVATRETGIIAQRLLLEGDSMDESIIRRKACETLPAAKAACEHHFATGRWQ